MKVDLLESEVNVIRITLEYMIAELVYSKLSEKTLKGAEEMYTAILNKLPEKKEEVA